MKTPEQSSVAIKSNVTLKSRKLIKPIDNLSREYFDVRSHNNLTYYQQLMKEKMLFWAHKIYDEDGNSVKDECFKGCLNCGHPHNDCQLPQNRIKKRESTL